MLLLLYTQGYDHLMRSYRGFFFILHYHIVGTSCNCLIFTIQSYLKMGVIIFTSSFMALTSTSECFIAFINALHGICLLSQGSEIKQYYFSHSVEPGFHFSSATLNYTSTKGIWEHDLWFQWKLGIWIVNDNLFAIGLRNDSKFWAN